MKVFEKSSIVGVLNSPGLAQRAFSSRLSGEFYTSSIYGFAFDAVKEYWLKYRKPPTKNILKRLIEKSKLDDDSKVLYAKKLLRLYGVDAVESDFSIDNLNSEAKKRTFVRDIERAAEIIGSSGDVDKAIKLMNLSTTTSLSDFTSWKSYDYLDEWENRQKRRKLTKGTVESIGLMTKLKVLDDYMKKGCKRGSLNIIAAKTGVGKTNFLVQIGVAGLFQGASVTHVTLENPYEQLSTRYDARITRIPYDMFQLYDFDGEKKKYRKRANKTIKFLRESLSSKLRIVEAVPTKTNMLTIYDIINTAKLEGHNTELLIIDSFDIMDSLAKFEQKRLQVAAVYWEGKALFLEQSTVGWSSAQLNRVADDEKPSLEDLSEAYDKSRISDKVLGLSRTIKDKIEGTCTIGVLKDRDGPDGYFVKMGVDFSRMLFKGE